MNQRKQILGISGSTKKTSSSRALLAYIQGAYAAEIDLTIYDQLDQLPHFNPELEKELPAPVQELRQLIATADGLLFCTPEYVFSLPGSLKNLIEWNVSTVLFSQKPVAMIVAAASGQKAFESLDLILTTIESVLPKESKLLIQGAKGKIQGNQVDLETEKAIDVLIQSLLQTIQSPPEKATKFL